MKCFIRVIILCTTLCVPGIVGQKPSNEYPDLQELFPIVPLPEGRRSPEGLPNLDINIERIDIEKFKKKIEIYVNTLLKNVSKEDSRRQQIPYYSVRQYNRASRHLMRAKTMDLMLQTIYMARHSVKQLENEKYFSKTDTGYRIAFLYRRIRRIWRKMMDIYTLMMKNYHKSRDYKIEYIMALHLKVIQLHTDFLYLWWVLITVDGKYTKKARKTRARQLTTKTDNLTEVETENPLEQAEEGNKETVTGII